MEIAEIDLAGGVKLKNFTIKPMLATVEFVNPPKELVEAARKDKLIVQNIAVAVIAQLNESKGKVQAALVDFDARFKPSGDKAKDEAAADQLKSVCLQICTAQKSLAEAVAQKKWQEYVARNKAWTKAQIKFACKVTAATIGLSVAIVSAALSGGTTAVAVIGMAGKVYTIGKEIYEFAKDVKAVEEGIVTLAAALAKRYGDPTIQKMDWKAGAQEIAAALGAPFAKGTTSLAERLEQHEAKLGQLGKKADSAYEDAKTLMEQIAKLEQQTKGTAKEAKVKELGERATKLLETASTLNGKVEEGETFQEAMTAMNEQFILKRDATIGPLKEAVDFLSAANEVRELAQDIVDLAKALA